MSNRIRKAIRDDMTDLTRRRLLKALSSLALAPLAPAGLFLRGSELLLGESAALAAGAGPKIFIEISLRAQWDLGQVYVAPGFASVSGAYDAASSERGLCLFHAPGTFTIGSTPNGNVRLTPGSVDLLPHVDTIAQIDTFEIPKGTVHGHEAVGTTRSPGHGDTTGAGWYLAGDKDRISPNIPGNEDHYASVPTPAAFHNHYVKSILADRVNGIAIKGCTTDSNVYHVEAGLPTAELERLPDSNAIVRRFQQSQSPRLATAEEAALLADVLKHIDSRFFKELNYTAKANEALATSTAEAHKRMQSAAPPFTVALSDVEKAEWGAGMTGLEPPGAYRKPMLWEMLAMTHKLVTNDVLRTVAIEADYGGDIHIARTALDMRRQTEPLTKPLALFIQKLKDQDLWDDTVIAIFTVDGGREPARKTPRADYYEGKNSVIFAGGKIKGGYYGDLQVGGASGNPTYTYHAPNMTTGVAGVGVSDNTGRIPGASAWATVMQALGVPRSAYANFGPVANAAVLSYLLRS